MKGLTLSVRDNDVSDWSILSVLALVAQYAAPLTWQVEKLEFAPSPAANRAQHLAEGQQYMYADLLVALALNPQLIAGTFTAYKEAGTPVIKIEAVRGDEWDVYSADPELLRTVQRSIPSATAIPQ